MEIDKTISNLVKYQFPRFYQAEGPTFVAFVEAYYEWMEQSGYTINASKSLLEYSDIDKTLDQFVETFKNEFLINFPSITTSNKRFLIKNIKDFYQSKGSTRGLQLLFRLLFDDDVEIYNPGKDILKPSDGIWKIPNYIEVEHNIRSRSLINKEVTGSVSDAKAFVESVYTKVVNDRLIDVLSISGLRGNFRFGELITDDGNFFNAPKVIGSLTEVIITDGGANNKVGDIYEVYNSTSGKGGKARIAAVEDGTGRVLFTLVDGGSGYTNSASQVRVSNVTFTTSNRSNPITGTPDYIIHERVSQALTSLFFSVAPSGSFSNTAALYQSNVYGWSGASVVATGLVAAIDNTPNTFIINTLTGDFNLATSVRTESNAITFSGYTLVNVTSFGFVTGSNSTALGLYSPTNSFYGNGAVIRSASNTTANVGIIYTGAGANFEIGSLTDTEVLFLFTDFVGGNNVGGTPFLNMIINGANGNTNVTSGTGTITCTTGATSVTGIGTSFSTQLQIGSGLYDLSNNFIGVVNNVTNNLSLNLVNNALVAVTGGTFKYNLGQYGFIKNPALGLNNYINDMLSTNTFTIGTIASLKAVNPGSNYSVTPFVMVRNDLIAGYNRKNIILELNNSTGIFAVGDQITQAVPLPTVTIGYNANTGAFSVGEGITQSNGTSNSYATINTISTASSTMILTDIIGTILANSAGGQNIRGLTSTSTANVTTATSSTIARIARGKTVSVGANVIEIKRNSFNESFVNGSLIYSSSGGSANVVVAYQNVNSLAMGNNANVSANVSTAKGIASRLEVINSGFGHQPGDTIELLNANNIYAITGTANVYNQGKGEGYWVNTQGMLNSDKYIFDGEYYQNFSYEIQTRLSLDKYADVIRQLAHVVGTKMYGKVLINSKSIQPLNPLDLDYGQAYVLSRSGDFLLDSSNNNIITINRRYTVGLYTDTAIVDRFENQLVDYQDQTLILRG